MRAPDRPDERLRARRRGVRSVRWHTRRVESQLILGVTAVVLGVVAGAVLFVPFVAIAYRRRGTFSVGRMLLWLSALVYTWAVWTYTLLPLPDPRELTCAGRNLDPMAFADDIDGALSRVSGGPVGVLTDPAVLQLTLNVLLFVPLGFFVRVLAGRGVLIAGAAGLAVSAFIEFTQLTGVWGLYPCAYRVFDVDDLLTNTLGAVLGSVAGLVVPRRHRGVAESAGADDPRPVTKPRRLLAMLTDWMGAVLLTAVVMVVTRSFLLYVADDREAALEGDLATLLGGGVTAAVWFAVIAVTGASIGDLAVRLRYTGGRGPRWWRRIVRYLTGIGGYTLLGLLPTPWSSLATVFAVVAVVATVVTRNGRGLPGLLSGQDLVDDRASVHRSSAAGTGTVR